MTIWVGPGGSEAITAAAETQNIEITPGERPYLALFPLVERADKSVMLKGNVMDFQLYILTIKTQNP